MKKCYLVLCFLMCVGASLHALPAFVYGYLYEEDGVTIPDTSRLILQCYISLDGSFYNDTLRFDGPAGDATGNFFDVDESYFQFNLDDIAGFDPVTGFWNDNLHVFVECIYEPETQGALYHTADTSFVWEIAAFNYNVGTLLLQELPPDESAPQGRNFVPADAATEVNPATTIEFDLWDQTGMDWESFRITIQYNTVSDIYDANQCTITTLSHQDWHVALTPAEEFPNQTSITIEIYAEDLPDFYSAGTTRDTTMTLTFTTTALAPPQFSPSFPGSISFSEDQSYTLPLPLNDYVSVPDPTSTQRIFTVNIVSGNLAYDADMLTSQNVLYLTPYANWNGNGQVQIIVTDYFPNNDPLSDTATLNVQVISVNDPPQNFHLIYPQNRQVLANTDLTLDWASASDPDIGDTLHYTLYYGVYPVMNNQVSGLTTSQHTLTSLDDDTKYYWKVGVQDESGASAFSYEESVFFVNTENHPPQIVNMPDTVNIDRNSQTVLNLSQYESDADACDVNDLVWSIGEGQHISTVYDSLNKTVTLIPETNYLGLTSLSFTLKDPSSAQDQKNVVCNIYPFEAHPPQAFDLIEPASGQYVFRNEPLTFRWTPAIDPDGDAVTYTLSLGLSNQDFSLLEIPALTSPNYTMSAELVNSLPNFTDLYWHVQASDGYSDPIYSGIRYFYTYFRNDYETLDKPQLISPANNATLYSSLVTFQWETVQLATEYHLYCAESPSFGNAILVENLTALATSLSLTPATHYYWKIRAFDKQQIWRDSDIFQFAIGENNAPYAFQLEYPDSAATVTTSALVLNWNETIDPDDDPILYRVRIGQTSQLTDATEYSEISNDAFALPTTYLQDYQQYYWQVVAYDDKGGTTASPIWPFQTASLDPTPPPAAFDLISPTDSAFVFVTHPLFSWEASSSASGTVLYQLICQPLTDDFTVEVPNIASTSLRLQTDLPEGQYQWKLFAIDPHQNVTEANNSPAYFQVLTALDSVQLYIMNQPWNRFFNVALVAPGKTGLTLTYHFDDQAAQMLSATCQEIEGYTSYLGHIRVPSQYQTVTISAQDGSRIFFQRTFSQNELITRQLAPLPASQELAPKQHLTE